MALVSSMLAALALAGTGAGGEVADACRPDARGAVNHAACAAASPPGSPQQRLALINLGTEAFLRHDYANAVRFYDEAQPKDGQKILSDPAFHAFRASAYSHVGRAEDAAAEARIALAMLEGKAPLPAPPGMDTAEALLPYILPVLKAAKDPGFERAAATYRGLPARDWISHANRAGVLLELDDLPGAMAANDRAMALQPGHPMVLNNACILLTKAGRPAEALAACDKALAAAPEVAAIHDSRADALVAAGKCAEAQAALATARRLDTSSAHYRRTLGCEGPVKGVR